MSKGSQNILSIYEEIFDNKSIISEITNNNLAEAHLFGGNSFKWGGGPSDHGSRALGNWQSDNAWDIMASEGTPVYSISDGKITKVGGSEKLSANRVVYGYQVSVDTPKGNSIFYTHIIKLPPSISPGNEIKKGDLLGYIGKPAENPKWPTHVHIGIKNGSINQFISNSAEIVGAEGVSTPSDTVASTSLDSSTSSSLTGSTSSDAEGKRTLSHLAPDLMKKFEILGKSIFPQFMKEQKEFGPQSKSRGVRIIIPGNENPIIKAPYNGIIDNSRSVPGCSQQLSLKLNSGYYLIYCNMDSRLVTNGTTIIKGSRIGTTSNDVTVHLYDQDFVPVKYSDLKTEKIATQKEPGKTKDTGRETIYHTIFGAPFRLFQDKYDKSGNRVEKRWGYSTDKDEVDPWIVNAISKPFKKVGKFLGTNKSVDEQITPKEKKLVENIEKIKRLIK